MSKLDTKPQTFEVMMFLLDMYLFVFFGQTAWKDHLNVELKTDDVVYNVVVV